MTTVLILSYLHLGACGGGIDNSDLELAIVYRNVSLRCLQVKTYEIVLTGRGAARWRRLLGSDVLCDTLRHRASSGSRCESEDSERVLHRD